MKKTWIVSLLLLMTLSLSACGWFGDDDETPDGRIEITFWHMSPVGSDAYPGTRRIIRAFNESQDKYFVRGTGLNFWDYWDRIGVAIAANNAPDIGFHTLDNVILRAQNDALYNLSALIEADLDAGRPTIEIEAFLENQLEFATYEGHLYALPFTATTRVLYYNLDAFAEVGLTEDDVPTTWSELYDVAKQLDKVSGSTIERIGFDPTYGQGTYHGYLWQNGLDFFDEDLEVTLDTQAHVDVLEWMINFNTGAGGFTRNQLNTFGEGNQMLGLNPFAAGRVGMIIETDGLYQTMKIHGSDINFGVAPIPVPDEDGIRINWGSGFSIEMYNNKDAERLEATWAFMKYLMDYDTQMELAEVNGWLMAHYPAMETFVQGNPILEALLEEVQFAVDKVYVPYAPNWHANDWQRYYDDALSGRRTPAEVIAMARANYLQKQENFEAAN